ncbi:MAG: ribosome maturation factor RimM [Rickettsiales bacterium]|jgi:16S rRNA processing protein RimM|nr:ribosome maturation factor RimM [Rickettsiales bacterium]
MTNITVGKILTSHGVKGYVKLESWMENKEDIFNYELFDESGKKYKIKFIGNLNNNCFIAEIEGITIPEVAKELRNTELYADLQSGINDIYLDELIGVEVRSDGCNGKIISIDNYGAGNIVEIEWDNENHTESLPLTDDYFKEVTKEYVIVDRPKYT